MFCSHCGKTLKPEQEACPHCGVGLGQSRLDGHTSVQRRVLPTEEPTQSARYTPYTKTTYTSMEDTGEDVYSRTAYRPVLTDAGQAPSKPPEQSEEPRTPPEESVPAPAAPAKNLPEHQVEELSRLHAVPEDAPTPEDAQRILAKELDIKLEPLKPIRKTGISPEVEGYIQRMESMKRGGRRHKAEEDEPEEAVAQDGGEASDADEAEAPLPARKRAVRLGGKGKWVKRILGIAAIVALVTCGVIYLALTTQPRSPIEGVSSDLFDIGIQTLKTRLEPGYKDEIIALWTSDQTGGSAMARQAADIEELNKLLPEKPMENDQLFIDTMVSIQGTVNTANTSYAFAEMNKSDAQVAATFAAEADEQWGVAQNAILRLEDCDTLSSLKGIGEGVEASAATPEPSPEPSPSPYQTLKRGMTKSEEVRELQRRLYKLGWFTGARDGAYGAITVSAVKRFQNAAGLEVTGIADSATQEAAFAEDAPRYGDRVTPPPATDMDDGQATEIKGGEAAEPSPGETPPAS